MLGPFLSFLPRKGRYSVSTSSSLV